MGNGYISSCSKCGYKFEEYYGIGMLFPYEYTELVSKAKNGELGTDIKEFFDNNPDGVIDAERVTLCCNDCGNLEQGENLSMYIPKDGYTAPVHERWSVSVPSEDAIYVSPHDLKKNYKRIKDYKHVCSKCSGKMKVIREAKRGGLCCPKCKTTLETTDMIRWD